MKRLGEFFSAFITVLIGVFLSVWANPVQTSERRHIPLWLWLLLPTAVLVWIFRWWVQKARQEQESYYQLHITGPQQPSKQRVSETPPPEPTLERGTAPLEPAATVEETEQTSPAKGPMDDLTIIEGIGPKIAQLLREHGITTFRALAETSPDALRTIFRQAKLYFVDPSTWPEQAKLAAEGRWDELEALKVELVAGKKRQ